ncbi:MAG: hypothetical protein JNL42_18810 [Anaerolineae bacterium]|nr:hypothetical protein [Anaerolineae bacterium]
MGLSQKLHILLVMLGACLTAGIGTALAQDDDAKADVIAAFDRLSEGYRFTYSADTVMTVTDSDGVETINTLHYESAGAVDAAGSYHIEAEHTGSSSAETDVSVAFSFQRASADGVDYVYLSTSTLDLWQRFLFEGASEGWHRADDLLTAGSDGLSTRVLLDSILPAVLPGKFAPDEAWILDISEGAPEAINGAALRVFAMTLDGRQMAVANLAQSGELTFDSSLIDQARVLAAGTFEGRMRAWVGAADGRFYRLEIESLTILPYHSSAEDGAETLPFDYKTSSVAVFELSAHGQVEAVEAPEMAP